MRISVRISGAGHNGLTKLPCLNIESIDRDLCVNGKLDPTKLRHALDNPDYGMMMNSDDDMLTLSFAAELVHQVYNQCKRMIAERRSDNNRDAHDRADCADDRHAERNMAKGKFVFVRLDISAKSPPDSRYRVVRLCVNIDNPKEVVGVAEKIAEDYALIVARIANNIREQMEASNGKSRYEFVGGPGCPDLFERARVIDADLAKRAAAKAANIAIYKCERRTASGHCSPCKFDCPHFKAGMCVELEVKK